MNDSLLEKEIDPSFSPIIPEGENNDNISEEQKEKLENKKEYLKEQITNISDDINELHDENLFKNYVDIYITFKNPFFAKIIYNNYKKNKSWII